MTAKQRGFTLIEVMVALVIVAILAAIAIPAYTDYVTKARRSAAKNTLLDVVAKQENHFADIKQYAPKLTDLGFPSDTVYVDSDGTVSSSAGDDSSYTITMQQTDPFDFVVFATARGNQSDDTHCKTFKVNHQGTRTATSDDCW